MQALLEESRIIVVECIFGELLQGTKTERERNIILSYWNCLPKIYESNLWLDAGIYSNKNKLVYKGIGLIDSVIILSVLRNNLLVWTLDKKLSDAIDARHKYR
jgi:hypothetical protein